MIDFTKPARFVNRVFIHCSANDNRSLRGEVLLREVRLWHTLPKPRGNGWSDVGYHYLIDKEGATMAGRSLERMPAAQYPENPGTIAIMVHGLRDFPPVMLEACRLLCAEINEAYEGRISFHGHLEVNAHKTCPVFPYKDVLALDRFQRMV